MIIGICGLAGSGKSTVADFLVRDHQFVSVALADPLKRICRDVFDFTDEQLWGPSAERNKPDHRYPRFTVNPMTIAKDVKGDRVGEYRDTPTGREFVPLYLTPRHALQQLGTEWGRNCYPNVWVDYALRVATALLSKDPIIRPTYSAQRGLNYTSIEAAGRRPENGGEVAGVVISDVRFLNEVAAILKAGGEIWKVERPGAGLQGAAGQHVSEQELQVIPAKKITAILDNDQTLDHLRNLVGLFLERSKA